MDGDAMTFSVMTEDYAKSSVATTMESSTREMTDAYNITVSSELTTRDVGRAMKIWSDYLMKSVGASRKTNHKMSRVLVSNPSIQPEIIYLFAATLVGPGLLGNLWLFCMTLRAEMQKYPYRIYLRFASVTDSVSLVYIYTNLILQANGSGVYFLFNSVFPCIVTSVVTQTAARMSAWIMVVFVVDRFVALVFPLKRKALCTVRNARIACGLVLVLCLSLQLPAAASTRIVKQRKGRMVCSVLGNSVFVWSTIEAVLNMLLPCCLLMYFNTHTLIAIRRGMRSRLQMMRPADISVPTSNQTNVQQDPPHGNLRPSDETTENRTPAAVTKSSRQAEAQAGHRELNKMTRALLTLPLVTFVTFTPYTVLECLLTVGIRSPDTFEEKSSTASIMDFLQQVEAYLRIIFSVNFASSFYLLMATSKSYRQIARNMLCGCLTRQ